MNSIRFVKAKSATFVGPGKLKVVNGRLSFATKHGNALRLDFKSLKEVTCIGKVGLTDRAIDAILGRGIVVIFLNEHGTSVRGQLGHDNGARLMLRRRQWNTYNSPQSRRQLAIEIIVAKIESMKAASRHFQKQSIGQFQSLRKYSGLQRRVNKAQKINEAMGLEGQASRIWFNDFGSAIPAPFSFSKRTKRPPKDPVNSLLSLGYTFLLRRIVSQVLAKGFEVELGMLHEIRTGRPSLACDLIEPLRALVVDRWVVRLLRKRSVALSDFETVDQGKVVLKKKSFPLVLKSLEKQLASKQKKIAKELDLFQNRIEEIDSN